MKNLSLKKMIFGFTFAFIGLQLQAQAQEVVPACSKPSEPLAYYSKGGRFLLGSVKLDDTTCKATMNLPDCNPGRNDYVEQIQFAFRQREARIKEVKLTFDNGGTQLVELRNRHLPNTESRWVDLKAGGRCIRKIEITGDAFTDSANSVVPAIIRISAQ